MKRRRVPSPAWAPTPVCSVAAYGSYYRVGHPKTGPFEAVLASAAALGAPHIRVWPGSQGSDSADEAYFQNGSGG